MEEKKRTITEELEALSAVDVRTVDPAGLVDIESVKIRTDLPERERVLDYLEQIKNPYCYLYHGIVVKLSFSGKCRLEDCLKDCIFK